MTHHETKEKIFETIKKALSDYELVCGLMPQIKRIHSREIQARYLAEKIMDIAFEEGSK